MTLRVAFGTSVLAAGLLGDGVDGIGTVTRELLTRLQPRAGLDLRPFEFAEIESGCIDGSTAVGDYRLQARRALLLGRSFSRLKHMVRNKVDLVPPDPTGAGHAAAGHADGRHSTVAPGVGDLPPQAAGQCDVATFRALGGSHRHHFGVLPR